MGIGGIEKQGDNINEIRSRNEFMTFIPNDVLLVVTDKFEIQYKRSSFSGGG